MYTTIQANLILSSHIHCRADHVLAFRQAVGLDVGGVGALVEGVEQLSLKAEEALRETQQVAHSCLTQSPHRTARTRFRALKLYGISGQTSGERVCM